MSPITVLPCLTITSPFASTSLREVPFSCAGKYLQFEKAEKGSYLMRKLLQTLACATILGLVGTVSLSTASQAETGAVRVVFTKGGFIIGVGGGRGVLVFRGHSYPFT